MNTIKEFSKQELIIFADIAMSQFFKKKKFIKKRHEYYISLNDMARKMKDDYIVDNGRADIYYKLDLDHFRNEITRQIQNSINNNEYLSPETNFITYQTNFKEYKIKYQANIICHYFNNIDLLVVFKDDFLKEVEIAEKIGFVKKGKIISYFDAKKTIVEWDEFKENGWQDSDADFLAFCRESDAECSIIILYNDVSF